MSDNEATGNNLVLVVHEVEETRHGIQELLRTSGYRVDLARGEEDAILAARRRPPNLILISPCGTASQIVAIANRTRERSGLPKEIPVVIFCVQMLPEGSELQIGMNVHL